jgi:hypothetical protein
MAEFTETELRGAARILIGARLRRQRDVERLNRCDPPYHRLDCEGGADCDPARNEDHEPIPPARYSTRPEK